MSTKVKPEVVTARTRLDATLQHLVDRKDETLLLPSEPSAISVLEMGSTPSPSKRSTPKSSRKRKRREDSEDFEGTEEHKSEPIKLFDRSVDPALFPEDTPLYPVCRAWIQNRPYDKTLGTIHPRPVSPKQEECNSDTNPHNVYSMPHPIKSEDGCLFDLRVPQPVEQPKESLDIHQDPRLAPPAEQLLLQHMARWKEVRQRWHESSVVNEMQYASSINILKEMYDRTMGET